MLRPSGNQSVQATANPAALAEWRARRGLAELDLADLFHISDVVVAVEKRIDRPITVVPVAHPLPAGINGLWLHTDSGELIVHHCDETPARSAVIVAHELGHISLGHAPDPVLGMIAPPPVTGDNTETIRTLTMIRGRGHASTHDNYDSIEELEAEMFARLAVSGTALADRAGRSRLGPLGRFLDTF